MKGFALACMVRLGVLKDVEGFDAKSQATGLQDLLICIEMLIAAVSFICLCLVCGQLVIDMSSFCILL